jgi:hypothetical protein
MRRATTKEEAKRGRGGRRKARVIKDPLILRNTPNSFSSFIHVDVIKMFIFVFEFLAL